MEVFYRKKRQGKDLYEDFVWRADQRQIVEDVGRSMAQILWVELPPTF